MNHVVSLNFFFFVSSIRCFKKPNIVFSTSLRIEKFWPCIGSRLDIRFHIVYVYIYI